MTQLKTTAKQVITDKGSVPIKIWTDEVEASALVQLKNLARLPFIARQGVAVMPDCHAGIGSTVGSVIATHKAIIPAAVGVDIGCGMVATRLSLKAHQLPDSLLATRNGIEAVIPMGAGGAHKDKRKTTRQIFDMPESVGVVFGLDCDKAFLKATSQLGTLGSGNHFIEICVDENQDVWVMLHSGSRGIGNMIGSYYITKGKELMEQFHITLPDGDLAYLPEGTDLFEDYVAAVQWAQDYAMENRKEMLKQVLDVLRKEIPTPFGITEEAINCFAYDTPIMTAEGVKMIGDVSGTTQTLLTENGQWVSAPVENFGKQEVFEVVLSRSGVKKHIRATAGHRWMLHNLQRKPSQSVTSELKKGDRLKSTFPEFTAVGMIDLTFAARGFVYGDGSSMHGKACALFCGAKTELLYLFEGYNKPNVYEDFTRVNCLPLHWKKERPDITTCNSDQLFSWLSGYFAADGDVDKTGRLTLASADADDLQYVRELCTKVGIGTFGVRMRMRKGYRDTETPLYLLGIMRKNLGEHFFLRKLHKDRFIVGKNAVERVNWTVVEVNATGCVEDVFCAVVSDTHSFALEDNILTGNCHHNYVEKENHFGQNLWVTRKGAIRAREGDLGIIPGSMGTRSYIVRGKGNKESYCSCSHGAGRTMSRSAARKKFTVADLVAQTKGIECLKNDSVLDEIPGSYKDIDVVMEHQKSLVSIVHTLKQVMCCKGG